MRKIKFRGSETVFLSPNLNGRALLQETLY